MVQYIPIDPSELDNVRLGRRGRVSYPILKGFLETNHFLVKLDRTGVQQSRQSLLSCLTAYCRTHTLPIKLFQRRGELYLMRLDVKEDGSPIPNWDNENIDDGSPAIPITSEEVRTRFEKEKGQTTK